jgi:ectoine hydroxylase-related dioxygenase (phytanoyl-CoA dioxygenase family)
MVVVEGVMSTDAIASFKAKLADHRARDHADESQYDGQFWIMDSLAWSSEVAKAVAHAGVLALCREYMNTRDIHFCHQPIITTLKPARAWLGTHPEGGWHSDYPYHPGVFPDDVWPQVPPYGVQFNICVDPFTPSTGATQFVPGSHRQCTSPPSEFNSGGTTPGEGAFAAVRQFEAPAGAAIIYDSRTWHRACHELNTSGKDRVAVLNAVAPSWVFPMIDKRPVQAMYEKSSVPGELDERQAREIERLCHTPTMAVPTDAPRLAERRPTSRRAGAK